MSAGKRGVAEWDTGVLTGMRSEEMEDGEIWRRTRQAPVLRAERLL